MNIHGKARAGYANRCIRLPQGLQAAGIPLSQKALLHQNHDDTQGKDKFYGSCQIPDDRPLDACFRHIRQFGLEAKAHGRLVDKILLFRGRSIETLSLGVKKNVAQYMGFWDCGMVERVWVFSRSEDQGCVHRIINRLCDMRFELN